MQLLPLSKLVENLRIESKLSTNPSRGLDSTEYLTRVINRNYELLWDAHSWNHLEVGHEESMVSLQAGQNIYDLPDAVDSSTITKAWATVGNQWFELDYGISLQHYSELDPTKNQRSDPVQRWEIRSFGKFEVHPMPASNVEFIGFDGAKRKFKPLVNQEDIALIDSECIILMSAAEILAGNSTKDAQLKLSIATQRISKMVARSASKERFTMNGMKNETGQHPKELRVAYVRN